MRNQAKRAIATLCVALLVGVAAGPRLRAQAPAPQAQDAAAERPKFDAASIKPAKPLGYSKDGWGAGGRLTVTGGSLRGLISMAYDLRNDQRNRLMFGVPAWAESALYDVETEADGNPTREQMRLMLQSLLADRFALVIHRETRQVPVYALVQSKPGSTGPQLQPHSDATPCLKIDPSQPVPTSDFGVVPPPPPACGRFMTGARRLAGNKVTMAALAEYLGAISSVDRTVVDRTNLAGEFDMTLNYTPEPGLAGTPPGDAAASDPSAPPRIFAALKEQLGLTLKTDTGPVEVLVIDHVEPATEN